MLNNLFSSFDYKNFFLNSFLLLNYFLVIMIILNKRINKISIIMKLKKNFMMNYLTNKNIMITSFMMIFLMNLISLNMYSFSMTSHLTMNLPIIIMLWMPILMITLTKKNNNFLVHMLPKGTSLPLIPMMILIELTSFFMRPMTMILRLTINMMAGHILVALLSDLVMKFNQMFFLIMLMYMMMKILVSLIQAYIIVTLINMYEMEIYVKKLF